MSCYSWLHIVKWIKQLWDSIITACLQSRVPPGPTNGHCRCSWDINPSCVSPLRPLPRCAGVRYDAPHATRSQRAPRAVARWYRATLISRISAAHGPTLSHPSHWSTPSASVSTSTLDEAILAVCAEAHRRVNLACLTEQTLRLAYALRRKKLATKFTVGQFQPHPGLIESRRYRAESRGRALRFGNVAKCTPQRFGNGHQKEAARRQGCPR